MRYWLPILMLAGLAACSAGPDARYQFGVSADRTSQANEAATQAELDRRANQICTLGYSPVKADTLNAEGGGHIADLDLACNPYQPDFWPSQFTFANLF